MIKKIKKPIFPKFAYIPIISVIIINCITYYICPMISEDFKHHDLGTWIDDNLPFCGFFVVFYVLAYLQWVLSYIVHCRTSKENCHQIASSDIIAKLICFTLYIAFPVTITRPQLTSGSFFDSIVSFLYSIDKPVNLFPSIHCLESWICFRGACLTYGKHKSYVTFQFIFSVLVFASTVLIKQHFFADIIAGVLAVEIGWFLTKKFNLGRIFDKIKQGK